MGRHYCGNCHLHRCFHYYPMWSAHTCLPAFTGFIFKAINPDNSISYSSSGIDTEYLIKHTSTTSTMEQDDTTNPSPKNRENNPLESRYASRSKATSGVVHETASPHRQPEPSGTSSGKQTISHAIKSLLPHSTHSASGKKSKNNPRSPLPPSFQGHTTNTTPALASMSEDELTEAHVYHSRQANTYLEELVRRRHPAPPAWEPPKNWQVSKASEHPPLAMDAEQPRLRDVGSLASVDEGSLLAGPSHQARKDSALTQGAKRSIASAGGRRSSKVVRSTQTAGLVMTQITLD